MDKLTPKERVFRAINFEEVDVVPVIPRVTVAAAKWKAISISTALVNHETQLDALIHAQQTCKYDGIYANWESPSVLLASAMGASTITFEDIAPRLKEGLVKTPECAGNLCIPHPKKAGRIPTNLELTKNLIEKVGNSIAILNYVPGPFSFAAELLGLDEALNKIFQNPQLLKDVMEFARICAITYGVAKIKIGAEILIIADPLANFENLSPKQFEDICFPKIKKMISELRLGKTKIGLQISGNCLPLIDLIAETGADFLELDSKVDLSVARKSIKKDICLSGNIDITKLFMKPSLEIEEECLSLIKKMDSTGFILSSGAEVKFRTPIENICAMVRSRTLK
ncbi:MAG: uroporphyrinogen decarboxylase family protein [Candidatus Helarchaeota archaeon]